MRANKKKQKTVLNKSSIKYILLNLGTCFGTASQSEILYV